MLLQRLLIKCTVYIHCVEKAVGHIIFHRRVHPSNKSIWCNMRPIWNTLNLRYCIIFIPSIHLKCSFYIQLYNPSRFKFLYRTIFLNPMPNITWELKPVWKWNRYFLQVPWALLRQYCKRMIWLYRDLLKSKEADKELCFSYEVNSL